MVTCTPSSYPGPDDATPASRRAHHSSTLHSISPSVLSSRGISEGLETPLSFKTHSWMPQSQNKSSWWGLKGQKEAPSSTLSVKS